MTAPTVAAWSLGVLIILLLAADTPLADAAGVVHRVLEPVHVSVWINDRR